MSTKFRLAQILLAGFPRRIKKSSSDQFLLLLLLTLSGKVPGKKGIHSLFWE